MSQPRSYKGLKKASEKLPQDPKGDMTGILEALVMNKNLGETKQILCLGTFAKLISQYKDEVEVFGFTSEEILYCLRPVCFSESTKVKNAAFRAVRHFIKTEEHIDILLKLKYDFLIAREITGGGIQLSRRILAVAPHKLPPAPVRAMVALSHPNHTDKSHAALQLAALAFLAETALLNDDVFITCGGVSALIQPLPSLESAKMVEALLGPLLYLANKPSTRENSGISLQCLTASVYMDPSFTSNKNESSDNGKVQWSTEALSCLLKSWTGLLHLGQGKRQAIHSIVNNLYIYKLQKPIIEFLYKLFKVVLPEWTDEMSVALAEIDPSRWQRSYRLDEGFIAAEAAANVPHLAKAGVNLVDVHRAVVLYYFLDANILDAIVHIIVGDDTFLSVYATILLGEILHLAHILLPPELVSITPGLPNLISYAIRGSPAEIFPGGNAELKEKLRESCNIGSKYNVWATFKASFGKHLKPDVTSAQFAHNCIQNQSSKAQGRALSAILAISTFRQKPPTPFLYLGHFISCIREPQQTEEKPLPAATCSCDEAIKETGVLTSRDPFTWNWEDIRAVITRHGETIRKSTDSNKKLFLRRLVNFILPDSGLYGRKEKGNDQKKSEKLTHAALALISMLLKSSEELESHKYLLEILSGIRLQIDNVINAKSAHDCFLSPSNTNSTHCQDYFLFLGHLSRTPAGRKILEKTIYDKIIELVKTTNQEYYVKLIVSTLDYSNDEVAREILTHSLKSKLVSCRLYATKILHTLIKIGICHNKPLLKFVMHAGITQTCDENDKVVQAAFDMLQEAAHVKEYAVEIINQKPNFDGRGDRGLFVLVRCLSTEQGFEYLSQVGFVEEELKKWGTNYNYRYVGIVESLLSLECSEGKTEVYLPPHLYQQLACHQQGLALVLADPYVSKLIQVLELAKDPGNDEELMEVKAALYSLSGIACVLDDSIIYHMVRLATTSDVYSLRAVAIIACSNIATSPNGVSKLQALGWFSVVHDRHERWPLIPHRDAYPLYQHKHEAITASDRSPLFDLPEETLPAEEGHIEDQLWSEAAGGSTLAHDRRSATLPHSSCTPAVHHNRSYSESKAEQSDSSDYTRYESGRKSRSNSYTDSSTSGDSSSYLRQQSVSERVQTLSPIPSAGSLVTYHPPHTRRASVISSFSRNSLGGSSESILRSLGHSPPLPVGLTTYGELQQMSPVLRPKPVMNNVGWGEPAVKEELDFSIVDEKAKTNNTVKSSAPNFPIHFYMGISLPVSIESISLKEDKNLLNNHVTFVSTNLRNLGLNDLKNPSFHREICFLGPNCNHTTMVSLTESEPDSDGEYMVEGELDLEKEPLDDNSGDESSISDVESIVEKPMPIIFKSRPVIRSELTRMVEQLSNPILHKTCKQSLLQIKQAHGDLFEDICVFSDVCYVLSTCQVRMTSRDFVNELFGTSFDEVWSEAKTVFQEARSRRT